MKILLPTSLYPPHYVGGYELGCRDVVEGLRGRGHEVQVLTSTYGTGKAVVEGHVHRVLEHYFPEPNANGRAEVYPPMAAPQATGARPSEGLTRLQELVRREWHDQRVLRNIVRQHQPDVIYFWSPTRLSKSLLTQSQRTGKPRVFYVFDHWLAQANDWDDPWFRFWERVPNKPIVRLGKRVLEQLLRVAGLVTREGCSGKPACGSGLPAPTGRPVSPSQRPALDTSAATPSPGWMEGAHLQFASQFLQQQAATASTTAASNTVIPWGLNLDQFPYRERTHPPTKLLYVGRLDSSKGVHTAIQALGILHRELHLSDLTLTIVGTGAQDYMIRLHELVVREGLTNAIRFHGSTPREGLPALYAEHDILIFPSVWEEPFGIVLLEAMASGLAIVATLTGGSAEILQDGKTALRFTKEDAADCARQVQRLVQDSHLRSRLCRAARQRVETAFNYQKVLLQMESVVCAAACSEAQPRHAALAISAE